MTEEKNYFLTIKLTGNNVDKEISVAIPKDEHVNVERADVMELKFVKRIETRIEYIVAKSNPERVVKA